MYRQTVGTEPPTILTLSPENNTVFAVDTISLSLNGSVFSFLKTVNSKQVSDFYKREGVVAVSTSLQRRFSFSQLGPLFHFCLLFSVAYD